MEEGSLTRRERGRLAKAQTRFRHLLEEHQLTEGIFAEVRTLLEQKRLLLKSGTIVDAAIIAAPPSTKNAEKFRT